MDTLEQVCSAVADRYRIERELGAGGMATVYLARDLKHDNAAVVVGDNFFDVLRHRVPR